MPSLLGKTVVVTGASSGIGAETARLFAAAGSRVVLCARRLERLEALAGAIRQAGGEALPLAVDVSQPDQIRGLIASAVKTFGRIDILFNNAGFGRLDWAEALDPVRDVQAQVTVDLLGVIWTAQAVLPVMYSQGGGHIINMGSIAGYAAPPLYTIYAAAKFGVRGFSEALRREAAPFGVRVSVIHPGGVSTEFQEHMGDNAAKRRFKTPRWLLLSAQDVARAVVRLARRPRRTLVLPWWMSFSILANAHFGILSDLVQARAFAPYHQGPGKSRPPV